MIEVVSAEALPTPQYWIALTTGEGTIAWVRPEQITAYGDAPVGQGASWIQMQGIADRYYLLQTVGELHILLGNTDAISQSPATETHARDSVWVHPGRQG